MTVCDVCFRHCTLEEGEVGFCGARANIEGEVRPLSYGHITAMALDRVEKKPLRHFFPGTKVLSIGSYGCNLACPFCQNASISMARREKEALKFRGTPIPYRAASPKRIAEKARGLEKFGNIGVAYTYNEPLIGYEFVRDTARRVRAMGMKNILVTNGTATSEVLDAVLPYMDGVNIDLKSFNGAVYRDALRGNLDAVLETIRRANDMTHVEVTTLAVPGLSNTTSEIERIARFLASLPGGRRIPLHISRFFPAYAMAEEKPTDPDALRAMGKVAKEFLDHVYLGNL